MSAVRVAIRFLYAVTSRRFHMALCCVCGVLGHLAPVHRCARAVCCVACAVSWATRLLFTGVPARCVVSRVRCPGPPGSCSPVCPLGVFCCVYGVLGLLACTPPSLAGVFGRVWLCVRSACTPPFLARVCGVGVCAWARVLGGPRQALLAEVFGFVFVCVRAPLVTRHSWPGCDMWVCVLQLGFRLRPTTPGWGVGVYVCLCARSACTPQLLVRLCGVGVCAWARIAAAPSHSWLGHWAVCVFVCALRLYPATPGWGVRYGCVCLNSGFGCAPPLLAGVLGCVCVCVRAPLVPRQFWLGCAVWCVCLSSGLSCAPQLLALVVGCVCPCVRAPLYPATPGWVMRRGCVCLGVGFGCAPPVLVGMLGCVCVCLPAPLVPRQSLLGCAVWVCVLGLGFWLQPATPGWGVGVCVCLCASSSCTPPNLARVCGVCLCAWARVSAAPRHSWLGCRGVFLCLCARSACTPPLLAGMCGVGVCAWVRVSAAPRHS